MTRTIARIALALAAMGWLADPAAGTQHLVRAGDDWSRLAATCKPGDEIVLMPGQHRPAVLADLRGERGNPITIRSVAPHAPAVILADQDGLRLVRPQFVVVENIQIRDATMYGLLVDGRDDAGTAAEPWPSHLVIRDVVIERIGPQGNRHGMRLSCLRRVDIEGCRVEGWGGAAIEIVGSHDVSLLRCQLKGLPDHGQQCGVQMRGGSVNVRIEQSRFENAGLYAVLFGGRSAPDEFCPPLPETETAASSFEIRSGYVEKSLILAGSNAIGFFGAAECLARNCTIIRPRGSVLVIGHDPADPRVSPLQRGIFGANLILWKPGDLTALAIVDPAVDAADFVVEPNLWWTPELEAQREALGSLPGDAWEQIWDVNPELDAAFKPGNPDAATFGCVTP
jgi:hypothetical protein